MIYSIFNLPELPPKPKRGAPRIERLRWIVAAHSAAKVEGVTVDATTAGAYVAVWDKLTEENRAKLDAQPLRRAVAIVWKLVK